MASGQGRALWEQYHAARQNDIYEGQVFWNRITAFVLLKSALLVARGVLRFGPIARWIEKLLPSSPPRRRWAWSFCACGSPGSSARSA